MNRTVERSHIGPRQVGSVTMSAEDCAAYSELARLGINFNDKQISQMAAFGMDATQQAGVTVGSAISPVQFLQNWLPGFVRVITAARKIDELVGITTSGNWEDEEIVQGILEPIGSAVPYGDYTNVPLASWNANFVRRTVVRFEHGIKVGMLEEARTARVRIDSAGEKRSASALSLEVQRNLVGFNGYNSGNNLTYGFLNDPSLSAYASVATGTGGYLWSQKTFLEICADIRTAMGTLQNNSQDTINPEDRETTLAVPTSCYQYLSVVNVQGSRSVREWLTETYPKCRVVSAPQLNSANASANVFYLYAENVDDGASDDSRTWVQVVPAKFQALGVEKQAKAYIEDYTNATAGVLLKRPYAVVRVTGI